MMNWISGPMKLGCPTLWGVACYGQNISTGFKIKAPGKFLSSPIWMRIFALLGQNSVSKPDVKTS